MVLLDYGRTPVIKITDREDQIVLHLINGSLALARCEDLLSDYKQGKRIEFLGSSMTIWKKFRAETIYRGGRIYVDGRQKYSIRGNELVKLEDVRRL